MLLRLFLPSIFRSSFPLVPPCSSKALLQRLTLAIRRINKLPQRMLSRGNGPDGVVLRRRKLRLGQLLVGGVLLVGVEGEDSGLG